MRASVTDRVTGTLPVTARLPGCLVHYREPGQREPACDRWEPEHDEATVYAARVTCEACLAGLPDGGADG